MYLIFHLLLCLCLHACSARRLEIIDKETVTGIKLPYKNTEPSIAEGLRVQEPLRAGIDRKIILPSWDGANKMLENSVVLGKGNENNKGYNVILPWSRKVMHETSKLEDRKKQARSVMESVPGKAEESVDSKENDMGENMVVMDYAQPHRKPPIHNWEP